MTNTAATPGATHSDHTYAIAQRLLSVSWDGDHGGCVRR
jgi:hypothetical protein